MSVSRVADQQLLIGGDWVAATSGESFEIRNPYTGETASTAASGTADDVRQQCVKLLHLALARQLQPLEPFQFVESDFERRLRP